MIIINIIEVAYSFLLNKYKLCKKLNTVPSHLNHLNETCECNPPLKLLSIS